MEGISVSRKDSNRRDEEFSGGVADIEIGPSPIDGCHDTSTAEIKINVESERRQILHRVPPLVREKHRQMYEPLIVSFGPYHHGQTHLRQYEDFKDEVLNIILNSDDGGAKDIGGIFRSEILKRVHEIRSFYGELSTTEYNDEALVEMMIRDACLVLYFMEMIMGEEKTSNHIYHYIGPWGLTYLAKDFYKLENQIPFWVIKKLISLKYYHGTKAFICKYLSMSTFGDDRLKQVPWEEGIEKEPLHLLEADRRVNLKEKINSNADGSNIIVSLAEGEQQRGKSYPSNYYALIKRPFRSATELKAKGVYLRPTSVHLDNIKFTSHSFHGVLHLPVLVVDFATTTYFSNVIAMELSPGNTTRDLRVTSYINFMKSLIEKPEDVKLLQENGILISNVQDNEHIVKIFNEIDTHGIDNLYMLSDIKKRIDKHCNNYSKTWIAELILTKFRTPWSAIAVFAATFLLSLTFLQTYYTMK